MNLDLKQIGQYIQARRREACLTQAALGELLHVSAQSVSNWERGESLPEVSLLPDLAAALRCSTDAILLGGAGSGGFRRTVRVSHMQEALSCIDRIGELLGREHFVYRCVVDALNERMNTKIEEAFADPHIFDVFTVECLLGCLDHGDYADPRDVEAHLPPSRARDFVTARMKELGIN
ncbi:MAG: helix-turn-helix domain-containing protein [Oscillospiraceae bacterium]|nr:helix-turn-helix domain-containing protein [Oscillospiraceae bacterium]